MSKLYFKILDIFESIPATIIGGVGLVLSFVLPKLKLNLPIDLAWIAVIVSGIPLLHLAIYRVFKNKGISKISSALLISIAMIAAICIGDLFAAGEVAFIMAIGEILEDLTTDRAKKGLKKLISLAPTQARKVCGEKEEFIEAESLEIGDIIRILPGEIIAADGVIIKGETSVDESIMTGESLPVDKTQSDAVYCGTLNRFGAVDVTVTKTAENTSLSRLIKMVKEAEEKKAPMARIADKSASWLVPAALLIAIITGLVTQDITRAVTVLVVFCPCALVLATPTAIMAAIGQATGHGVIIKTGEALEKMGRVETVAFDKTGTLTYGKLEVCDCIPVAESLSEASLLSLAASIEAKSEHPIARAIVSFAKEKGAELFECENFKMSVGKGVSGEIGGEQISCTSAKNLIENAITLPEEVLSKTEELSLEGKAAVIISKNACVIGIIALSDVIRPEAEKIVSALKTMKTNCVLLTGDNKLSAKYFADKAGIDEVYSELLPENKTEKIAELLDSGKTVCMIGDGVNDAPALKTASVGIAMGSMGSDIAVEAADIALMSDDISKIPYLKRLSVATVKTIKFSIFLSMFINILAVLLSVLGVLNPTLGALVHNAGSCFVVLIAALLYDRKFE